MPPPLTTAASLVPSEDEAIEYHKEVGAEVSAQVAPESVEV